MTPQARYQAAIEILDSLENGAAAEQVLTSWARRNRFAGSKDRAAIRDIVFDVLRRKRSAAAWGGGQSGRSLVLGLCRQTGIAAEEVFTGQGYGPAVLGAAEQAAGAAPEPGSAVDLDCPDWLWPHIEASLAECAAPVMAVLRDRAPVFIRANLARLTRPQAQTLLAEQGVMTQPHDLSPSALRVTEGARALRQSRAYQDGLVELQDAASQAVADLVPLPPGGRLLDYCAGGGGKSLALAARLRGEFYLYDIQQGRMRDVPARAKRAGARLTCLTARGLQAQAKFDTVLADAPCSGSGAWRRSPEGKWQITQDRLTELCALQDQVLEQAAGHVRPGGHLVYATCSILEEENGQRVQAFLKAHPNWRAQSQDRWTPLDGGDGFFCAVLKAPS